MRKDDKEYLGRERRRYIRLDSVFPVQFSILSIDGKETLSDLLQGFTSNISKGGICLEVNNLKPEFAKLLKEKKAKCSLDIQMPLASDAVFAKATVAWVKEIAAIPGKYFIGLRYEKINPVQNKKIIRFARVKRFFAPVALTVIFILALGFGINSYISIKLLKGNKALVGQLVEILQESSVAKQRVKEIAKEREQLQLKIQAMQSRIQAVTGEKKKLEDSGRLQDSGIARKFEELNNSIGRLTQEKALLQDQLISAQSKEASVTEELLRLDKKKITLTQANLDKMYGWLKVHQNPRTGLVISFEGDSEVADWAFVYDQSLAVVSYTYFSDFDRAKKILDFFYRKAERPGNRFVNAYYARDGQPAEYVVHSGPNIWLGMAILHYTKASRDRTYLGLAEEIASSIIALQKQDKAGGIRGGPQAKWYSTEHNLDAYAFFSMLHEVTGKDVYPEARDKVLGWLVKHTYDQVDIPVKRGKGDATIATDTYAWSIAAIGPEKLESLGMNPDRIMDFAQKACGVQTSFVRPEGNSLIIKGFDFAPQRHVARGGVVSSEWTAQMVISFKIMAEFYRSKNMPAKAHAYDLKANEYLAELGKMIISSSSPSGQGESCLPYASHGFVDTGHGWMTPKGNSTGSVSGTAYTLFAYYNYNPLSLKE
ncbi:PilZ domain-containing protein [Candidatus Omnitrophota bacterium]